ncbi:hypothetical protein ACJ5ZS_13640 [Aeromonas salmonicida]|uniref:hypothetical protein n=1 Tax=Aeromonas salmonicida TaxID=645 RepID=UPI0038BC1911
MMVTAEEEIEYLRRLAAILEKNQARRTPSKREIFIKIEEAAAPLGEFMRIAGQVNDLVKHGGERSSSGEMSLGYHPWSYRLATHIRLSNRTQSERAKRPRTQRYNALKDTVRDIVEEHPGWTSEMIFDELRSNHSGQDQLLEKIDGVDYFMTNEGGKRTKTSTVRNWITNFKKKI